MIGFPDISARDRRRRDASGALSVPALRGRNDPLSASEPPFANRRDTQYVLLMAGVMCKSSCSARFVGTTAESNSGGLNGAVRAGAADASL